MENFPQEIRMIKFFYRLDNINISSNTINY